MSAADAKAALDQRHKARKADLLRQVENGEISKEVYEMEKRINDAQLHLERDDATNMAATELRKEKRQVEVGRSRKDAAGHDPSSAASSAGPSAAPARAAVALFEMAYAESKGGVAHFEQLLSTEFGKHLDGIIFDSWLEEEVGALVKKFPKLVCYVLVGDKTKEKEHTLKDITGTIKGLGKLQKHSWVKGVHLDLEHLSKDQIKQQLKLIEGLHQDAPEWTISAYINAKEVPVDDEHGEREYEKTLSTLRSCRGFVVVPAYTYIEYPDGRKKGVNKNDVVRAVRALRRREVPMQLALGVHDCRQNWRAHERCLEHLHSERVLQGPFLHFECKGDANGYQVTEEHVALPLKLTGGA